MKLFTRKYRIVSDKFSGLECQQWRSWFPFWLQMSKAGYSTNTFGNLDEATKFIRSKEKGFHEIQIAKDVPVL